MGCHSFLLSLFHPLFPSCFHYPLFGASLCTFKVSLPLSISMPLLYIRISLCCSVCLVSVCLNVCACLHVCLCVSARVCACVSVCVSEYLHPYVVSYCFVNQSPRDPSLFLFPLSLCSPVISFGLSLSLPLSLYVSLPLSLFLPSSPSISLQATLSTCTAATTTVRRAI